MRVLVVSGLWPPDVGGPATHAPDVCEWLHERGHDVTALTMADEPPERRPYDVRWVSRRLPRGPRHVVAASAIASAARRVEVIYSTGMLGRTTLAAALARRPTVLKLTSDPTFERSLRWGLTSPSLTSFQAERGMRIGVLRRARQFELGRAARILVPSKAFAALAASWGVPAGKTEVLPNPVEPPTLPPRGQLRADLGFAGPTLVFAGRLVPQKSLDVALEAVRLDGDVTLVLAGDGPERARLEARAAELALGERARFLGPRPRDEIFRLLRAADATLLSSSWENFPHIAVEALSVGTPVLATDAGGVAEIVLDGSNGLLAPPGDARALAAVIRRYFAEPDLQEQLRARAAESVSPFAREAVYSRLEEILVEVA